jgi:CBS domain containing-hemolysin-like protein
MLLNVLITFLLVFMNGFFVAAEFAIVKVRTSQIDMKIQEGRSVAILARHIVHHLDAYLAATQLGITLSSLGLGWIGEPVVSKMLISLVELFGVTLDPELAHSFALPVAFVIITVLHIVFGELAPKSLAIQRSEETTYFIAYPLRVFYLVCRPFIWMLNGIANLVLKVVGLHQISETEAYTRDELKLLVNQAHESSGEDSIEDVGYNIIKNAFSFSERTVRQVMVPRTQLVSIDVEDYDEEKLEHVIEEGYSRIPCYQHSIDDIIGVVHLKDILKEMRRSGNVDIRSIVRPVSFVPETKRISKLMREFQLKHQQIAIVLNEFGGTDGIITMEDILEELVGEIQDESDDEIPFVEHVSDNVYSVIAMASINNINEQLPHPIDKEEEYDTLAGYLIDKFGRIPLTRDKIEADGYEFTILKKARSSIALVQMRDLSSPDEG